MIYFKKGGKRVITDFNDHNIPFDMEDIEITDSSKKELTFKIELRDIMSEFDILNILLQLDGEEFKKIEIKRR